MPHRICGTIGEKKPKTYPRPLAPPTYCPHFSRAARSRRTIGGETGWRRGRLSSVRAYGRSPAHSPGTMSGRSGCTGRQLPRRQQGEDEAVPHGRQADDTPPAQRDERVSGAWGEVFLTFSLPRRTTGTEAKLAPCRSLRGGGKAAKSFRWKDFSREGHATYGRMAEAKAQKEAASQMAGRPFAMPGRCTSQRPASPHSACSSAVITPRNSASPFMRPMVG